MVDEQKGKAPGGLDYLAREYGFKFIDVAEDEWRKRTRSHSGLKAGDMPSNDWGWNINMLSTSDADAIKQTTDSHMKVLTSDERTFVHNMYFDKGKDFVPDRLLASYNKIADVQKHIRAWFDKEKTNLWKNSDEQTYQDLEILMKNQKNVLDHHVAMSLKNTKDHNLKHQADEVKLAEAISSQGAAAYEMNGELNVKEASAVSFFSYAFNKIYKLLGRLTKQKMELSHAVNQVSEEIPAVFNDAFTEMERQADTTSANAMSDFTELNKRGAMLEKTAAALESDLQTEKGRAETFRDKLARNWGENGKDRKKLERNFPAFEADVSNALSNPDFTQKIIDYKRKVNSKLKATKEERESKVNTKFGTSEDAAFKKKFVLLKGKTTKQVEAIEDQWMAAGLATKVKVKEATKAATEAVKRATDEQAEGGVIAIMEARVNTSYGNMPRSHVFDEGLQKYFNEDAMAVVKATNVSIAKANESIKKIPKIDSYFQELNDRLGEDRGKLEAENQESVNGVNQSAQEVAEKVTPLEVEFRESKFTAGTTETELETELRARKAEIGAALDAESREAWLALDHPSKVLNTHPDLHRMNTSFNDLKESFEDRYKNIEKHLQEGDGRVRGRLLHESQEMRSRLGDVQDGAAHLVETLHGMQKQAATGATVHKRDLLGLKSKSLEQEVAEQNVRKEIEQAGGRIMHQADASSKKLKHVTASTLADVVTTVQGSHDVQRRAALKDEKRLAATFAREAAQIASAFRDEERAALPPLYAAVKRSAKLGLEARRARRTLEKSPRAEAARRLAREVEGLAPSRVAAVERLRGFLADEFTGLAERARGDLLSHSAARRAPAFQGASQAARALLEELHHAAVLPAADAALGAVDRVRTSARASRKVAAAARANATALEAAAAGGLASVAALARDGGPAALAALGAALGDDVERLRAVAAQNGAAAQAARDEIGDAARGVAQAAAIAGSAEDADVRRGAGAVEDRVADAAALGGASLPGAAGKSGAGPDVGRLEATVGMEASIFKRLQAQAGKQLAAEQAEIAKGGEFVAAVARAFSAAPHAEAKRSAPAAAEFSEDARAAAAETDAVRRSVGASVDAQSAARRATERVAGGAAARVRSEADRLEGIEQPALSAMEQVLHSEGSEERAEQAAITVAADGAIGRFSDVVKAMRNMTKAVTGFADVARDAAGITQQVAKHQIRIGRGSAQAAQDALTGSVQALNAHLPAGSRAGGLAAPKSASAAGLAASYLAEVGATEAAAAQGASAAAGAFASGLGQGASAQSSERGAFAAELAGSSAAAAGAAAALRADGAAGLRGAFGSELSNGALAVTLERDAGDLEARMTRLRQAAVGFALASPLDLKNGTRSGARPASFSETAADDVRRFVSTVLDYESGIDGDLRNSSATNVGESGLDPH